MAEERKIESAVCRYARQKGCYVRKFSSPAHRGVPDDLFITPDGVVFFIEFKAPGKVPTDLQERELAHILSHNGNACYVDNVEKGVQVVEHHLKQRVQHVKMG